MTDSTNSSYIIPIEPNISSNTELEPDHIEPALTHNRSFRSSYFSDDGGDITPQRNTLAWFVLSRLHNMYKWLLVAVWFHFVVFLRHDPSIFFLKTHLEVGLKLMQC